MIIIVFSLLLIIGLAGAFWGPSIAFAAYRLWDSCPRGIVNCIYPGLCRSYIDTNRDSICDRSQSNPEPISSSTTSDSGAQTNSTSSLPIPSIAPQSSPSSTTSRSSTTTNSSGDTLVAGTSDSIIRNSQEIVADTSTTNETENAITISDNRNYYFIPIFMVIIVLYTITWILSARKVIGNLLHRKIWNMILLISSIGSILLGLILTLNIDFDTNITLPFNMLFWHVEAGIALGIVALFHIFWHWRYFTKILRMLK